MSFLGARTTDGVIVMLNTAADRVALASRRILVAEPSTAESTKKLQRSAAANVVCGFSLAGICLLAFSLRLFSVIKYESVIHEFDPYFNYRVTQFLTKEGFYNLWNWFDDRTWYPLGRVIGGTVYPVSMLGRACKLYPTYELLHQDGQ